MELISSPDKGIPACHRLGSMALGRCVCCHTFDSGCNKTTALTLKQREGCAPVPARLSDVSKTVPWDAHCTSEWPTGISCIPTTSGIVLVLDQDYAKAVSELLDHLPKDVFFWRSFELSVGCCVTTTLAARSRRGYRVGLACSIRL